MKGRKRKLDGGKVIVIGGGPAGMMAAGTAAARGADVILLEKNNKLGKKLYITGKGRCNLTNIAPIELFFNNIPVNGDFLYSALYTFDNQRLLKFFADLGLKTKTERGGRVFPISDKASDIIKALETFLKQHGVIIRTGERVKRILQTNGRIKKVILTNNSELEATAVVLATGGKSYPGTGSTGDGYIFARDLGHNIISPLPSLVPLEVNEDWVNSLSGLKLKNIVLSVYRREKEIFQELGEMTFTGSIVDGPLILSASCHLGQIKPEKYKLIIDLKPALNTKKLDSRIRRDFKHYSRKHFANSLADLLPSQLIPVVLKLSDIPRDKPVHQITRGERRNLVNLLKNLKLTVSGYRPFTEAIITSGGIDTDEIDPSTMESKKVANLYFAGEIIDVTGYTGGYNLQIAFSTGYLAGIHCSQAAADK